MSRDDFKLKVGLAGGGSLGNPGHSLDEACVLHRHIAAKSKARAQKHDLIAQQQTMQNQWCPARTLPQQGRAHSPVQRERNDSDE